MSLLNSKNSTITILIGVLLMLAVIPPGTASSAERKKGPDKIAFANLEGANARKAKTNGPRYTKPAFVGKSLPSQHHKGLVLIGAPGVAKDHPANKSFYRKIKQALDLIDSRTPQLFKLMQTVNPTGRRVIYYTGRIGPASFVSWGKDFVVNITATNIHEDPVFENTVYSLAATLVHELVGHGRQESDRRVWAMYDWCGKDSSKVDGVLWQANHKGASSGFVEYEAHLFAKWFLESVRGVYPDLNEPAIRRYVKTVRLIKRRFPGWYDERKSARTLLGEFKDRFQDVCPGLKFTPHPVR